MKLLSSAIIDQAVKETIANKLYTHHLMTHRLQQLDTHHLMTHRLQQLDTHHLMTHRLQQLDTHHLMTHRLHQLDTRTGFFLLKNAFSLPRLPYLLRSSPCYLESDDLATYDECTRNTAESICNVQFEDTGSKQAKLHARFGGLGLRSAGDLTLQAYCSRDIRSVRRVNACLPT